MTLPFIFSAHAQQRFYERAKHLCNGDIEQVKNFLKPLKVPGYFYLGNVVFACKQEENRYMVLTCFQNKDFIKQNKDKTSPEWQEAEARNKRFMKFGYKE